MLLFCFSFQLSGTSDVEFGVEFFPLSPALGSSLPKTLTLLKGGDVIQIKGVFEKFKDPGVCKMR